MEIIKKKNSTNNSIKQKNRIILKKNILEGINSALLRSQFIKIVPSFPYQNYIKLNYNYKYQGIITGLYKDKLSGNLNLLIDLGLKEDLIVLKETYDRNIDFFKNSGLKIATGKFGADMKVSLVNDGPVTFMLEL